VQSLPTEAKPLSACSQCGTALPPPTGSATFVYGVGAVGYQSCDTCGAKWRYLWKDPPGTGGGLNRLPFLLVGAVIVALLVVGVFGALRSPSRYTAGAESSTTTSAPRSVTTTPVPSADTSDYHSIVNALDSSRSDLLTYLETTGQSAPQNVVNQKADAFVKQTNDAVDALKRVNWPASVATDIDQLVAMQQQFTSDLELIQYGQLYSPSFTQQLETDVASIRAAEGAVSESFGASK
jgi:hypothetical protein